MKHLADHGPSAELAKSGVFVVFLFLIIASAAPFVFQMFFALVLGLLFEMKETFIHVVKDGFDLLSTLAFSLFQGFLFRLQQGAADCGQEGTQKGNAAQPKEGRKDFGSGRGRRHVPVSNRGKARTGEIEGIPNGPGWFQDEKVRQ